MAVGRVTILTAKPDADATEICYSGVMTRESLEILLDRVAAWPEEDQEKVARFIDEIEANRREIYQLNDQERAAVRRGFEEMRTGQLASDEEVAAVFTRYR